jgi:hypothetical protein
VVHQLQYLGEEVEDFFFIINEENRAHGVVCLPFKVFLSRSSASFASVMGTDDPDPRMYAQRERSLLGVVDSATRAGVSPARVLWGSALRSRACCSLPVWFLTFVQALLPGGTGSPERL